MLIDRYSIIGSHLAIFIHTFTHDVAKMIVENMKLLSRLMKIFKEKKIGDLCTSLPPSSISAYNSLFATEKCACGLLKCTLALIEYEQWGKRRAANN